MENKEKNSCFFDNALCFTIHRKYGLDVTAFGKIIVRDGRVYSYDFSKEADVVFSLLSSREDTHNYNELFEVKSSEIKGNCPLIRQEIIISTLIDQFDCPDEDNELFCHYQKKGTISDCPDLKMETIAGLLDNLKEDSKLFRRWKDPIESDYLNYMQDVTYYGIINGRIICLGCEYLYEEYISTDINARILHLLLSSFDGYDNIRRLRKFEERDSRAYIDNHAGTSLFDILEMHVHGIGEESTNSDNDSSFQEELWEDWW